MDGLKILIDGLLAKIAKLEAENEELRSQLAERKDKKE